MFKCFIDQYFNFIKNHENVNFPEIIKMNKMRKIDIGVSTILLAALIALSILSIFVKSKFITLLIPLLLIALFTYCTIREQQKLKQPDINIKIYNEKLDILKHILKGNNNSDEQGLNDTTNISNPQENSSHTENSEHNTPNNLISQNNQQCNQLNWYSKNKIQCLISFGEKELSELYSEQEKKSNLIQKYVFPIIAFMAGVIQNNASVTNAISIGIMCLFCFIILYSIRDVIPFIVDVAFNNLYVFKAKTTISLLQDLLTRDFID